MEFPVSEDTRDEEKRSLEIRYDVVSEGVVRASVGGNVVHHELSRSRRYFLPGLRSEAPGTEALYRLFEPLTRGKTVLDVGAGSGVGALVFADASEYLGIDRASEIVSLARAISPAGRFEVMDVEFDELPPANVVTVVDLLGMLADALAGLKRIARAISPDGLLLVAEPEATIAQGLLAPMKRAFTKSELSRLLFLAGFRLREWKLERGFLAGVFEWDAEAKRASAALDALSVGHIEEARSTLGAPERFESGTSFDLLARIERRIGNFAVAFETLCSGNGAFPSDPSLLVQLSELALEWGEAKDAERFASAAVRVDHANAAARCALALSFGGDASPEVLALWSNAARLLPSDLPIAVEFARTAAMLNHYAIGILALDRASGYSEELPMDVHGTLGLLHAFAGNVDAANLEAHHIRVMEPHHPVLVELDDVLRARHAA